MSVVFDTKGYLEHDYLTEAYLSGIQNSADGFQFNAVITKDTPSGLQFFGENTTNRVTAAQFNAQIDTQAFAALQTNVENTQNRVAGFQFEAIVGDAVTSGVQFESSIGTQNTGGFEFSASRNFTHYQCAPGYLADEAYLTVNPYLAPFFCVTGGFQFFADNERETFSGLQFNGVITQSPASGFQFYALNNTERAHGFEVVGENRRQSFHGFQVYVENTQNAPAGLQFEGLVNTERAQALQFNGKITQDPPTPIQFEGVNNGGSRVQAFSIRASKNWTHYQCGPGYLDEEPYLTDYPYLAPAICAAGGLQFDSVQARANGFQFRVVIYNTTNLRILSAFPSRGTSGTNWTASSTLASTTSAFSANNVNTDIVEQVWRSSGGGSATLTCDTEQSQGVFVDTLAILNHNFGGNTTVLLERSTDGVTWSLESLLTVEKENIYYVAESLPLNAYRYWRIAMSDSGLSFFQVGTVLFGSSIIFQGECFVDQVRFGKRQFADKVFTEGHTNVSNDRGKKRYVGLEFRNLEFGRANFQQLREVFDDNGTLLKALYIPTPQTPSRFAVFGKLAEIPEETHNYKDVDADYVDLNINVDESL